MTQHIFNLQPVGEEKQHMQEVEKILDKKYESGQVWYLMKWKECSEDESTWETVWNFVSNCVFDVHHVLVRLIILHTFYTVWIVQKLYSVVTSVL